ncbi:flippase [Mesonia sp. MT50]|uniref:Flippase n=1 Tax=Mesonia profundi TaxID=3070998 RepID=A0ABU1A0Y2_9FLAO|nr:flippase [Mesonia profundi]MDQ7916539.1 flippase [Mesonia profundi]
MRDKISKLLKKSDQDQKEIIKKGVFFMGFRGIGILAGYLFTLYITNNYGPDLNGLVTLSFSIFMFASIIGRLGIDVNLIKFYARKGKWEQEPGLFYRVLLKSFLVSLLLVAILFLIEDFIIIDLFRKPQLSPYYFWGVLAIPGWVVTMLCAGALRAKGLNNWFAFFNNTGRFLFALLLVLILGLFTLDPLNVIVGHFYGICLLSLMALGIVIKNFRRISLRSSTNSWSFIKDSFPMMLSSTIMVFLGWMDTFILGIYETDESIGIYNVALKLALVATFSIEAINSSLAPKIAKLYEERKNEQFLKLVKFSTRLNFGITTLIVATLIIFNQWFLGIFGDEFKVGSLALIILCSIHLINSAVGSVGIIMQMIGKQKQYQYIAIISLCINLTLNFLLIPIYGIIGAAVATAISLSVWNITGTIYLKRKENIRTYL